MAVSESEGGDQAGSTEEDEETKAIRHAEDVVPTADAGGSKTADEIRIPVLRETATSDEPAPRPRRARNGCRRVLCWKTVKSQRQL